MSAGSSLLSKVSEWKVSKPNSRLTVCGHSVGFDTKFAVEKCTFNNILTQMYKLLFTCIYSYLIKNIKNNWGKMLLECPRYDGKRFNISSDNRSFLGLALNGATDWFFCSCSKWTVSAVTRFCSAIQLGATWTICSMFNYVKTVVMGYFNFHFCCTTFFFYFHSES